MTKRMIWSNMDLNVDDWRDGYKEYLEINGLDEEDADNEYKLLNWMHETNADYLDDEIANLNKRLDGRILAIGDLGLWYGRRNGYKILGNNLNEIFNINESGFDVAEFYSDGHDILGRECHHDGTNYFTFRMIREDRNVDNLLDAIYSGEEISKQKLNYYTKSIHEDVANIYGW